ncbi:MAG: hypothetical protein HY791_03300 [Deltaproteobacteria bacterium]|nr:hypothetical protein [Deltaproteobacteria bacterium]
MSILSAIFRPLFAAFMWPFGSVSPWAPVALISLVTALLLLILVKHTTNQVAIAATKRKIEAAIFEIRLFSDDARIVLGAQKEVLLHNLTYLRFSLPALLVTLPPVFLIVSHLEPYLGRRALTVGEEVVLVAEWTSRSAQRPASVLRVGSGVVVRTPGVWVPSKRQMAWRLEAVSEGAHPVEIELDGARFEKTIHVSRSVVRASPITPAADDFLGALLEPGDPPIPPKSTLFRVELDYPVRSLGVLGLSMSWMIPYFVLSMILAFLLRKPFGVEI